LSETERFIPVTGVVYQQTPRGVSFEVARRRVFIPTEHMSDPSAVFETGEPAVLLVLRRFAEEQGVIASAKTANAQMHKRNPGTVHFSEKNKDRKAKAPSRFRVFEARLIALCVIEIIAATQSGKTSWKTKPCRLLLRLLAKPDRPLRTFWGN